MGISYRFVFVTPRLTWGYDLSTYRKNVLLVISRSSIIIISEQLKRTVDVSFKTYVDFTCVSRIDNTAAISDINVAETIDTKVSSATCFSVLLSLSILLTITEANPNSTVNTIEKTVVNSSAKLFSTTKFNLQVQMYDITQGKIKKHKQSQREIRPFLALLKTLTCSFKTAQSRTFLLQNSMRKTRVAAVNIQTFLSGIYIFLLHYAFIIFV